MPLTEVVVFNAVLQRGNRIQVPRDIRWRFKMEPDQVLKVEVFPLNSFSALNEVFYICMTKDGRIAVPSLTRAILQSHRAKTQPLEGSVLKVRLSPA